jgi:hypothetical protein
MKKQAIFILAVSLVVVALSPIGAEDKVSKPRSDEVVIVARLVVTPAINRDFYSHYVSFDVPGFEAKPNRSWKGKLPDDLVYLQTKEPGENIARSKCYLLGAVGDIGFAKVSIPTNREIEVVGGVVNMVDNDFLFFDLPILRKIVVPAGVNYIYLGTFTYTMKDEFFNISEISNSDEFDAAVVMVKKTFGDGANLVRVNLLDLSKEKEKLEK